MTKHTKLTDQELMAEATSKAIISDRVIMQLHERLLCKPVKDMTFIEFRALQLLNEKGIGISNLINLHSKTIVSKD